MARQVMQSLVPVGTAGDWRAVMDEEDRWLNERIQHTVNLDLEDPNVNLEGALLSWPRADGRAFYIVSKDSPLTLQHVDVGDAWFVEDALIRGLRREDVMELVRREQGLARLFGRRQ